VFVNKRSNRAKILWFERHGYCLLYKRLHRAIFRLPAVDEDHQVLQIDGRAATLLAGEARRWSGRRTAATQR